ncbi:MAG: glycosyltransferase, partial [Rickettsiales bacterium]|nr:glycosyltransferase [Rickettsiales bacterium]
PTDAQWDALIKEYKAPQDRLDASLVAVIVPVYRGYDETLTTLYTTLATQNETAFTLTVINDCSPDDELTEAIDKLAEANLFQLIKHEKNLGFVRSANEGMRLHKHQDVVLLNADTEVYDTWLDRLCEALERNPRNASATPFSNHAELCSYPRAFHSNRQALELSYRELDQLAAYSTHDYTPELPTGVGFCMMLRRAALDEVGYFDEDTFGRGYGEENDWCLRATDLGWRHVLAGNVFVRHTGSVSFASHKSRQLKRALRKINQRHPHYRELVRAFKDEDPLRAYRQQLDLARLQYLGSGQAILMISHNAGGGTERHVNEMSRLLAKEGVTVYRLSPDAREASRLRLWHEDAPYCPNLTFDIDHDQENLVECLNSLGVRHMHLHHLLGFPQSMAVFIEKLARDMRCEYDVTMHDYYMICPSINLTYEKPYYDGDPCAEISHEWASANPTPAGRTPIWQWRERHKKLLNHARRVFTPSNDTATRIQKYFPEVNIYVRPHQEVFTDQHDLYREHRPDTPLSIAVIGHLTLHKGLKVILEMAQDAKARNLPVHFHVFGNAAQENQLKRTGHVTLHGEYAEDEIADKLDKSECHIAFIPSVWPETYSYTLSIALACQLYPVTFNVGAPADRMRQAGWGEILPLEWIHVPANINDTLLKLQTQKAPADLADRVFHSYPDMLAQYYGGLDVFSSEANVERYPNLAETNASL